jgi:hypothetical protein
MAVVHEQMHQWAGEEEQVRQIAEDVLPVLPQQPEEGRRGDG